MKRGVFDVVLRTGDPEVWSIDRCEKKNSESHARMYRGWVRTIRYMCVNDWDWPIIVTGLEGVGKSAFAINLACDLDESIENNLSQHIIWDLDDDFIEKILKSEPSAFVLDEAGVDLFSRDFMKEKTKEIIRLVILMRQFNHVPILVLPKLKWLDSYLRDHRVNNWVDVGWFGGQMRRIRGRYTVYFSEHHPMGGAPYWNAMFTGRFANYPETIAEEYRIRKRLYTENRFISRKESILTPREEEIMEAKKRGLSNVEISKFYRVSHTAVNKWVKKIYENIPEGKGA